MFKRVKGLLNFSSVSAKGNIGQSAIQLQKLDLKPLQSHYQRYAMLNKMPLTLISDAEGTMAIENK